MSRTRKRKQNEIDDRVNDIKDETESQMSEVKRKQDEIDDRVDNIENDVREMKQQFDLLNERFDRVADQPFSNFSSSNKEIIIMGGEKKERQSLCSVRIFKPNDGTYAKLSPMNIPRHSASSCVYNNDVIIAGGCHGEDGLDTIEILKLDQYLPRWTISRGKLPVKLFSHVLVVYREKLLVIGGINGETDEMSNEIHELSLDRPYTPTLLTSMPQPRHGLTAEIVNDKLFILGGITTTSNHDDDNDEDDDDDDDDDDDVLDSVMMYDFIANEFTTCASLPKPVHNMATVTWGNKIIVVGGRVKNRDVLNDVIMHDTESGLIEKLPSLKHNRADHSAVICDDVIVVIGGWNNQQGYLDSVEYWKIGSDDNWKELPGMTEKRRDVTAAVIP